MFYTYILKSTKTNKHYIGSTGNLEKRLIVHNRGGNISTKNDKPWCLIHSETFSNRHDAEVREKEIKSYKGGNAFKKLTS